jgi:hypothetical protein
VHEALVLVRRAHAACQSTSETRLLVHCQKEHGIDERHELGVLQDHETLDDDERGCRAIAGLARENLPARAREFAPHRRQVDGARVVLIFICPVARHLWPQKIVIAVEQRY